MQGMVRFLLVALIGLNLLLSSTPALFAQGLPAAVMATLTEPAATPAPEVGPALAPVADTVLPSAAADAQLIGEWATFIKAVGGAAGLGGFGIAALVVQLVMLGLKTHARLTPGKQLAAVTGLSVAIGTPVLAAAGLDLPSAVAHSGTLAAAQVFGHQALKKLTKKGPF